MKESKDKNNKIPWAAWVERGLVRISGTELIEYRDIADYISNNFREKRLDVSVHTIRQIFCSILNIRFSVERLSKGYMLSCNSTRSKNT